MGKDGTDCAWNVVCTAITVECFVHMLRGCVWYVSGYVRKKALVQCLCNY